jgi:hypothetical protein
MSMSTPAATRVSPVIAPEAWDLPGRPEGAAAAVQDAYRQTTFQLGADLRLLHTGMNLQLRVVKDSHPSRFRTYALAASLMPWSRAFLALSDAATLVTRGSYAGCPALVRTACECIAASAQLRAEELPRFMEWLAGALRPQEEHKAVDVGMGQFFAGSTIAADRRLSLVYRAASELARPHLGAGLLLVAPESNATRLAVTFADQSFHFGWAQLVLGWLLALCEVQLRLVTTGGADVYHVTEEVRAATADFARRVDETLAHPARCAMEPVETAGGTRWLVHNVRRQSAGAPRKLLL